MTERTSIPLLLFKVRHFELHWDFHIWNQTKLRGTLTKQILTPQSFQLLSQLKELVFHYVHLFIHIGAIRQLRMIDGVFNAG